MQISVVVPFRNEERHIARCLTALTTQEPFGGDYEIIAVADRSTDGSTAIARRFSEVRVVPPGPGGPYAARNAGVGASQGAVVAFIDGDCEAAPDWLRRTAEAFRTSEAEVLVGPRMPATESFLLSLLSAYELAKDEYVFGGGRVELYYASANNMAVRRGTLEALGGFAERRRGSDTLFVRHVSAVRSPAAVEYVRQMRVRHLEIAGVADYYGKCMQYGRSMRVLRSPGRSLNLQERLTVWRRAVRQGRYSSARAALMLMALGGGALCWTLGSASAALSSDGRRR